MEGHLLDSLQKNIEKFKLNLASEFSDISEPLSILDNTDVNEIYKLLYEKLHSLLDLYFPKVRLSRKKAKDKDWITMGIKRAIRERNKWNKQINEYLKETNIEYNDIYILKRMELKKKVRKWDNDMWEKELETKT